MTNHKSLYNGEFILKTDLKRNIQRAMYKVVNDNKVSGPCNIVAGPDVLRHIEDARELLTKDETVNIVEIDPKVHSIQQETLRTTTDNISNINCILNDVRAVESERVIDADLMGAVGENNKSSSCGEVLEELLKKQIEKFPTGSKAFLFTVALRPLTLINTLQRLEKLIFKQLGYAIKDYKITNENTISKNKFEKDIEITLTKQKSPYSYIKGRKVIDISVKYYNDSKGPMLTTSLIYK